VGKKDKGSLKETPQEKALAELALNRYQDYKQRWLPLQQRAIEVVEGFNKEGSWERERAQTNAGAVGTQIDEVSDQVADADMNRGVDAGSSNFKLRQGALGDAKSKSVGIARAGADEEIDNAYVEGISNLMRIGSNQAAQGARSMGDAASVAVGAERAGAMEGAARRAGNYELAGTAIGAAGSFARPGRGIGYTNTGGNTGEMQGTGAGPGDAAGGVRPWGIRT
jgi:hypothetical protein